MTKFAFTFRLSRHRNLINTFSDGVRGWFYTTTGHTLGCQRSLHFRHTSSHWYLMMRDLELNHLFPPNNSQAMVTGTFCGSKYSLRAVLLKLENTFDIFPFCIPSLPECRRIVHLKASSEEGWRSQLKPIPAVEGPHDRSNAPRTLSNREPRYVEIASSQEAGDWVSC